MNAKIISVGKKSGSSSGSSYSHFNRYFSCHSVFVQTVGSGQQLYGKSAEIRERAYQQF